MNEIIEKLTEKLRNNIDLMSSAIDRLSGEELDQALRTLRCEQLDITNALLAVSKFS